MQKKYSLLISTLKDNLTECDSLNKLAFIKSQYLGKQGKLTLELGKIKDSKLSERKDLGRVLNNIKIQINGQTALDNAIEQGKGVILISSHFGPWEILGHWLGVNNYQLRGVAHKQKNKGANRFFEEKRQLSGIKHIYRKVGMDVFYNILNMNGVFS